MKKKKISYHMVRKLETLSKHPKSTFRKYFLKTPIRALYKVLRPHPDLIADMSWDNLIVLDACRFDVFDKFNEIPGKLTRVISAGTHTNEWLKGNFRGRYMKDVVYVSANAYASYYYLHKTVGYNPFHKIVEVWKDGWNEELGTVHPSMVNRAALDSLVSYPQKRLLIHYLQPHHPFIGKAKIIGKRASYVRDGILRRRLREKTKVRVRNVWDMLQEQIVSVDQVWQAYVSNLWLVLDYVNRLLPNLTGRTCITSDHGNSFGTFDLFYGHPPETYLPELLHVPWLEVRPQKA